MLDTLTKIAPLAVSGGATAVAFLVYRINADKLFLEMLTTRRDAVRAVLDTAAEREAEATALTLSALEAAAYNLPAQSRFWRAKDAADGLFGSEVRTRLVEIDNALANFMTARHALQDGYTDPAMIETRRREFPKAVERLANARAGFVASVKPYTELGRRGLRITQRIRLTVGGGRRTA